MKTIIITFLVAIVTFIGGYYFGSNKQFQHSPIGKKAIITPTPSETKTASLEEMSKDIVDRFEQAQMERNAEKVLKLMTPPGSSEEKEKYMFLLGRDLPVQPDSRLYFGAFYAYRLDSYTILSINTLSSNSTVLVEVEETREGHDNTTGNWIKHAPKVFMFEIVKYGFNPYVESYYPKDKQKEKYAGFSLL